MKVKYSGVLLLTAILTFFGCDDNTGTLGMGMLPDSDGISAHTTTYNVITESISADSVYAKTSRGYVGSFTDPDFGLYEASFLTELNCTEGFKFPAVYQYNEATKRGSGFMAGDTVVSIQLVVFYSTWFGDSLNACRMSAYELNDEWLKDRKDPTRNYRYTNIDTKKYYNAYEAPLGRKAYTAYDTSIPDSVRNATDSSGNSTYYPNIAFTLDKDFGDDILQKNRNQPEYFKNADAFIENIFKGVYIKSDYGDGTVLYIDRVDLQMQFRFHYVDSLGVKLKKSNSVEDSLYYSTATVFASTKEVIQANKFLNSDKIKERLAEKEHTYIKSPAGIFTEAALPYDDIYKELSNDTLNAVKLTFTNYNQKPNYEFSMGAPGNVLLLRKQDFKTFFESNSLPDNVTSYTVSHNNVTTNQYTFNNLARLATTCINEKKVAKEKAKKEAGSTWSETEWEEKWNSDEETKDWDKVILIPVSVVYDESNSYQKTMTGIENDLQLGFAKLKGGPIGEALKLEVTYTTFGK